MAKQLGPTFGDELAAAGLGGKPLVWGDTDETITGRESLTTTENTTLDSVIAAHDPTDNQRVPTADFIARFTNQEYILLEKKRAADIANDKVGNAKNWDVLVAVDSIDVHRQKAQTVKADLVTDGVLTQARADEIFS